MFSSKRVRKRARHDTQGSSIPPILEPSVKREQPSGKSHSSIQQPSVNTRNVTQRIDTNAVYPGATQGLFHPQALNPSAIPLGQDDEVDMNSPFTLPAAATNPQLTVSPRVIQYPSGMTRQQEMGNTSRVLAPVVEATHTGAVDSTSSRSVSVQSSSISDPNTVSLQSHPTIPVAFPVQSVKGYDDKFSNVSQLPLSLPLITPPPLLSPPPGSDYVKCTSEGWRFDGCEIRYAFSCLKNTFFSYENFKFVRERCRQYCTEHWHDGNVDWNVSSQIELYHMLNESSYHNPLNLGLFKFLTPNYGDILIYSINNYEEEFSSKKIDELDFVRQIRVFGNGISRRESALVVNTLLDNEVSIGKLWNCCTLRLTDDNTLILSASKPLMELYHSIKDNETFLAKAKRENQVIDFQHIKILLTGSAAVGKTSFCRLLFQSKYSSEYRSTEVMEANQAMSIVNFSMLTQATSKKEVIWLKLDPKTQIPHFKTLLKSRVFHQPSIESGREILQEDISTLDVGSQEIPHYASGSIEDPIIVEDDDDNDGNEFRGIQEKILLSKPLPKTLVVDKDKVVKFITVIDSGGQPEYIHMLPAVNNSPTINFVVLDMTKDLDDPVIVQYKSKHNKSFKDYPLHYSNLDMIGLLMSLTTDSLEQPTKQTPTKTRLSMPNKSYIGFVGTHKDKLEKGRSRERIESFNNRLTNIVEERNCRFAVLPAQDGILFPVDNTTAGDNDSEDPVVKMLRQKIEDFMDKLKKSESLDNELPIRWMILELELQELHQSNGINYITYEEYKRIATEKASMVSEEAEESLQHFDSLGVLLHFEKVKGLCDYVIIDHQWLFDSLAMIMHLSPDDIEFQDHHFKKQFKETRLLAKSELCIIHWSNQLSAEYFFNLLIFLKVIATVTLSEVEYYYMPCILSSTKQYNDKYIFLYSAPLLVQFSSGFLPRGFFCSLVVHLLQNLPTGWDHQLHKTEHFSNVITFRLPDKSFLRLHDKTSYLEIQVRHHTKELNFSYHSEVFPVLSQYLKDVCKKLNFNHEKLQYGFLCHDGKSNDDHIALIKPFEFPLPAELECCRKCPHLTKLGKFHKIWFENVDETVGDDKLGVINQLGLPPAPDALYHNDKPKMWDLIKIVIPMIKAKWTHVAYSMQYDAEDIEGIEKDSSDSAESCERLFRNWLASSKGITPKTWGTLLKCIKDVDELAVTAENIDRELSTKYNC